MCTSARSNEQMHTFKSLMLSAIVLLFGTSVFAATYVVPSDEALVRKTDAVVVARALTSYVEDTDAHGIETVTVLAIEDVLKGDLSTGAEVKVRVTGGVLRKKARLVPGAPRFEDGERVVVFLNRLESGDYGVSDFGLGLFGFATDDTGRQVLLRTATEIAGWNTDGTIHHESRRDAEQFMAFIRGVANHIPVRNKYIVDARPLIGEKTGSRPSPNRFLIAPNTFTVSNYTMANSEGGPGFRWKVFPTQVNWNRGNTEINAGNGGSDAMNAAFASWNGDASSNVNYALTTTNANLSGSQDPADGVNNVVFEKVLTGSGAFSCVGGGVLGLGGVTSATGDSPSGDSTNLVNGEEFFSTAEGDVSMNVGVGACIGTTLSVGDFNSSVTHEIGHTLGFRHSDKTRFTGALCTSIGTYDCSSSAIMTAVITGGLNAALQTWDHSAVAAVYPDTSSFNPPTGVEAHVTSTTTALVSWVAPVGGTAPGRYNVYRSQDGVTFTFAGFTTPPTVTFSDAVSTNKAYLYKVRTANAGNTSESADSNRDLATIVVYTNATLTAGASTIQAVDINELRTAVEAVRTLKGLAAGAYTFLPATGGGVTVVHAADITELRSNVATAITGLGFAAPVYTNVTITAGTSTVQAIDFTQLRNAMR
jgi:hypothetical protein